MTGIKINGGESVIQNLSLESEQKGLFTQHMFNFRSKYGCCRDKFTAYKACLRLEFIASISPAVQLT